MYFVPPLPLTVPFVGIPCLVHSVNARILRALGDGLHLSNVFCVCRTPGGGDTWFTGGLTASIFAPYSGPGTVAESYNDGKALLLLDNGYYIPLALFPFKAHRPPPVGRGISILFTVAQCLTPLFTLLYPALPHLVHLLLMIC